MKKKNRTDFCFLFHVQTTAWSPTEWLPFAQCSLLLPFVVCALRWHSHAPHRPTQNQSHSLLQIIYYNFIHVSLCRCRDRRRPFVVYCRWFLCVFFSVFRRRTFLSSFRSVSALNYCHICCVRKWWWKETHEKNSSGTRWTIETAWTTERKIKWISTLLFCRNGRCTKRPIRVNNMWRSSNTPLLCVLTVRQPAKWLNDLSK